ncbi:MAG: hypothetical protein WB919_13895 [Candidatus Sulfotelmatobacter sp.]
MTRPAQWAGATLAPANRIRAVSQPASNWHLKKMISLDLHPLGVNPEGNDLGSGRTRLDAR